MLGSIGGDGSFSGSPVPGPPQRTRCCSISRMWGSPALPGFLVRGSTWMAAGPSATSRVSSRTPDPGLWKGQPQLVRCSESCTMLALAIARLRTPYGSRGSVALWAAVTDSSATATSRPGISWHATGCRSPSSTESMRARSTRSWNSRRDGLRNYPVKLKTPHRSSPIKPRAWVYQGSGRDS